MLAVRRLFWIHLAAAAVSLGIGYALRGLWLAAAGFALLAVVWAAAQPRAGSWGVSLGGPLLFIFAGAAAFGLLAGIPAWTGLAGVTAALGAWDLDHFLRRLAGAGEAVEMAAGLRRAHLRHLLAVEVIGVAAGLLALSAQLRLPFWWELLLAALAVIGLGQVIRHLRAQVGESE